MITRNKSAVLAGGGIFIGASRGGSAGLTVDRSVISDNQVDYAGGIEAVAAQGGGDPPASVHVTVVNSIITANRSEGAAAIFECDIGADELVP